MYLEFIISTLVALQVIAWIMDKEIGLTYFAMRCEREFPATIA
jgi:hypothetical protein